MLELAFMVQAEQEQLKKKSKEDSEANPKRLFQKPEELPLALH